MDTYDLIIIKARLERYAENSNGMTKYHLQRAIIELNTATELINIENPNQ